MPLEAGHRLGPYEILGQVGAGGMGEVYRARDHRLGRTVAVKILPLEFVGDPGRLNRFEFEARAAASLNHPNILAVHDVGIEDGVSYVVTELLDGQTLRELLRAQRLPAVRAIDFACQIAEGLSAVHGHGIVHRDLKPENIFITADGRAKILDFGVSKRTAPEPPPRTANLPDTSTFEIVGTPGYMAPEQVRGESVDSRTDVFAFGTILYEMLGGRRAFSGTSSHEILTAVESLAPAPLSSTPERPLSQGLIRLVERCLEKNPSARFQSTTDLAFALRNLAEGESASHGTAADTIARRSRRTLWLALSVVGVVLVSGAAVWTVLNDRWPANSVTSFSVAPPERTQFGGANVMAVSPDGQSIVLTVMAEDGSTQLFLRSRDNPELRPIPGTEGGSGAFWSPDGQYVGFFAQSKLKKIRLLSGSVQVICDASLPHLGASWNKNDVILFANGSETAIRKVSAAGGTATALTTPDAKDSEDRHTNPTFLPDGNRFLYFSPKQRKVFVASLDSTVGRELLVADSKALYVEPGFLLFMREAALYAQRFDAGRLMTRGEALAIAPDVNIAKGIGNASFSASNTGVIAHMKQTGTFLQLSWVHKTGMPNPPISFRDFTPTQPSLAPDGRRLAFIRVDLAASKPSTELWIQDLTRGSSMKLSSLATSEPAWSADSRELMFAALQDDKVATFRIAVDSAREPERVATGFAPTSWSPDGRVVIGDWIPDGDLSKPNEVAALTPDDGKIAPLWRTAADEHYARLSPDGRWLAYQSDESGSWEVYMQTYPPSGRRWQVSTGGGAHPQWRGDGRALYYVTESGKLLTVAIQTSPGRVELGKAESAVDNTVRFVASPAFWAHAAAPYAVTRDGSRFLIQSQRDRRESITVVVNWPKSVNLK